MGAPEAAIQGFLKRAGLTALEHRQSQLGLDLADPLRMPQWAGDPFHLGDCIEAIFSRRQLALRRTRAS